MPLERVLALDVGDRRVGLAISDPLGISARPLVTLDRTELGDEVCLARIAELMREEQAGRLLIGDPRLPSGDRGEQARRVDAFVAALRRHLGAEAPPLERLDESETTTVATARLAARGIESRAARESGRLDAEAACVLLEQWLAGREGLRLPPPPPSS